MIIIDKCRDPTRLPRIDLCPPYGRTALDWFQSIILRGGLLLRDPMMGIRTSVYRPIDHCTLLCRVGLRLCLRLLRCQTHTDFLPKACESFSRALNDLERWVPQFAEQCSAYLVSRSAAHRTTYIAPRNGYIWEFEKSLLLEVGCSGRVVPPRPAEMKR